MLGAPAVGKTAIVSQCLTSDYMNTYDASLGNLISLIHNSQMNISKNRVTTHLILNEQNMKLLKMLI